MSDQPSDQKPNPFENADEPIVILAKPEAQAAEPVKQEAGQAIMDHHENSVKPANKPKKPRKSATQITPQDSAPMRTDFNLAKAIQAKMDAKKLTTALAAKQVGVSPIAIINIFSKGSKPNSRTASKFAKWLGIDESLITGGKSSEKSPKAKKLAKPEKLAKTGRVPKATTDKAKAIRAGVPTKALPVDEVLAIVRSAIESAEGAKTCDDPILKDKLAQKVHAAPAKVRNAIEAMLNVMPG